MIRSPTPVTAPDVAIGAAMKQPRETASTHDPRYAYTGHAGRVAAFWVAIGSPTPGRSCRSVACRPYCGEGLANGFATRYRSFGSAGIWRPSSSSPRVVAKREGSTASGSASCSMAMPLVSASTATAI